MCVRKCIFQHVQCGDHYTVACTKDHELFYWGLRYSAAPSQQDEDATTTTTTTSSTTSAGNTEAGSSRSSLCSSTNKLSAALEDGKEEVTPRNRPQQNAPSSFIMQPSKALPG